MAPASTGASRTVASIRRALTGLAAALLVLAAAGCASPRGLRWERRVLSSLQSPDTVAVRRALIELRRPATPAIVQGVVLALETQPDPCARALAAAALGRLSDARAATVLHRAALQDADWVVRRRALRALAAVDVSEAGRAVPAVIAKDPVSAVRVEAINVAARVLAPDRAARIIVAGLDDQANEVVVTAHAALTRLTGKQIAPTDREAWRKALDQP